MTVYKIAPFTGTRSAIRPASSTSLTRPHPPRQPNQNYVTTQTATTGQHPPRRSPRPHTATAHRALPGGLGEARPPGPRLGPPAPSLLHGEAHEAAAGFRHRTGTELGDEPGGAGVRVPGGAGEGHACLEAVTVCWQAQGFISRGRSRGSCSTCVHAPISIWVGNCVCMVLRKDTTHAMRAVWIWERQSYSGSRRRVFGAGIVKVNAVCEGTSICLRRQSGA